jgi:hypothetical protein
MPDWLSSLLSALKLPARIIAGLFLFCVVALALAYFGFISLAAIDPVAQLLLILGAVLSGSLSLTALIGLFYDRWFLRHKTKLLSERREIRRAEVKRERTEFEAQAVRRLGYLTAAELRIVAKCLRKNEQSFTGWVHSSHVANLAVRRLVVSPGGTHHQDHYPYMFTDFAWEALLARKDEFIAKDDENKRREAAEKRKQLARPY